MGKVPQDQAIPRIALIALGLLRSSFSLKLSSSFSLKLRSIQPPRISCIEHGNGFGPKLVGILLERVGVDLRAFHRPEPPAASGVFQVAVAFWIDGPGKDALSRKLGRPPTVRHPEAISRARH